MTVVNNAKIIRRELLARLCKLILNDTNLEQANRIPLEMRPRKGNHVRCCVHRDRAVVRYKILAMLGIDGNTEDDELKLISSYLDEALESGSLNTDAILTVVDEACSACQKNNYVVTNMCQACVGRPCQVNCPKDSISFHNNLAQIDTNTCVNCGLCEKVCPFHAIIYSPVPCEDVCPVGAIEKDDDGKEVIDASKCTMCGKCMSACPFGAIVEKTELLTVVNEIKHEQQHIAMIAPAIAGQFREDMPRISGSLLQLGFSEVYEVAMGADLTTTNEAAEFDEKIEHNESMTTSCCPAYVNTIEKHAPELKKYVSTTRTPMQYTAAILREKYPNAKLTFIGPCMAKKTEAKRTPEVDFVLSFEEYGAWLVAKGIELTTCETNNMHNNISSHARNYAQVGGVTEAVASKLTQTDYQTVLFDGIDKTFVRKLKKSLSSKRSTLVEVMSCEGGCIAGCSTIAMPKAAKRQLEKFIKSTEKKSVS